MVLRRHNTAVWYTNFVFGGSRIRRSTGTTNREEAEQVEARLKRALWAERRLGEKPPRSWKEAVVEYAQTKAHKRTLDNDLAQLDKLTPTLATIPLHLITAAHINAAIDVQDRAAFTGRERGWKTNRGLSAASRNRYRAVARHLLNLAVEWEWIDRAPKIALEREQRDEARWLTPREAEVLLGLCTGARAHWRAPVQLALSTGLRASNVFGLLWTWVDLPRRQVIIPRAKAKAGRTLAVPLNDYAIETLTGQLGKHPTYVMAYRGKPMTRICPARFGSACKDAGLEDVTFHTLRHTWAAWHIMAGTPLYELMVMGGWSSLDMLSKTYGHLSTQHLAAAAQRIVGTKLVTPTENKLEYAAAEG